MERKTHYKMYKAGKNWVFAMLSTVALTGVMAMSGNTAKADAVAQSSTEQVAKVDTTGATTTQVEKAINNVNESNAAQTSATTTTEQSSVNADATSSSQNNKQATTTSVVTSQNTLVANKDQASSIQSSVTQNSKKTETVINTADNASQKNVNGNWYLVDNNTGKNLTGFQEIKYQNKVVYYAPSNAQMQYGWQDINNNRYYFDTFDGAMTTGQKNINGNWYMFDAQGVLQTGFQRIESQNKTVYYSEDKDKLGQMQYGKQNIDGHWYLFNTFDGAMYKGWLMSGNDWYYYNQQNGQLQTGSAVINGVGYNFDGNGKQILNYSIDYRYALPAGKGDDETAANNYIILHDVGKVYQVGRPGQVSWGAGRVANHNAPVQIELGRTYNSWQFWQDYVTYVRVARDMAGKYGIPLTLDAGGAGTRGIKSHYWVTKNIWGDHVDPYGYLSRFGVTQAKLAHDLLYGV